jgi:drug/metabolite transporter (DMT)-like permease
MSKPWQDRPDLLPTLGVALASVIWGIYWIPLRHLQSLGLEGIWPTLGTFLLGVAVLGPAAVLRRRQLAQGGVELMITGLFIGAAFATYATAILLTEVVRALLLFYLSPVWSTLLGLLFLNERLTVRRTAALALGIGGLIVVLGSDQSYPVPRNPGDWLALLSGAFWAYGSLRIFRARQIAVQEQSFAFVGGGLLISLIVAALPASLIGPAPSLAAASQAAVPLILIVIFMLLPIIYLTLIGAQALSPGRVGILLMGEVVVGVVSAAILTDEPFGLREVLGTLLILSAAGTEVVKRQPPLSAA